MLPPLLVPLARKPQLLVLYHVLHTRQGKNVVTEASRALTKAMWKAGPSVLNWKQKAAYVADVVKRKAGYKAGEPFKPSFSGPVQHFLLHAGASLLHQAVASGCTAVRMAST